MEIRLPFAGFYETMWSQAVDYEEEMLIDRMAEEYGVKVEPYQVTKYNTAYNYIAEKYPEYLSEILGVKLSFNDMTSPREYNFETDRIFADIKTKDAYKLYREIGKKAVRKMARRMFTSRDGFISHYSPDIDDWGQLRNWDHNQLYCMLEVWLEEYGDEWEFAIYEDMQEVISTAYDNAVDWEALHIQVGRLMEQKEEEDSERVYPVTWKNTQDYVKQYYELNSITN